MHETKPERIAIDEAGQGAEGQVHAVQRMREQDGDALRCLDCVRIHEFHHKPLRIGKGRARRLFRRMHADRAAHSAPALHRWQIASPFESAVPDVKVAKQRHQEAAAKRIDQRWAMLKRPHIHAENLGCRLGRHGFEPAGQRGPRFRRKAATGPHAPDGSGR